MLSTSDTDTPLSPLIASMNMATGVMATVPDIRVTMGVGVLHLLHSKQSLNMNPYFRSLIHTAKNHSPVPRRCCITYPVTMQASGPSSVSYTGMLKSTSPHVWNMPDKTMIHRFGISLDLM